MATEQDEILIRWGALKTERASWMSHWRDISNVLLPRSGRFFVQDRNRGARRHNNIYDSTGTRALRVLAAGLMSGITSPARPWFRLAVSDRDLMQYAPVKVWLNQVTDIMHLVFQKSNTYRALHQLYEELGAFGTGASIILPEFDNVIHHYPLTVGEYCIATDWQGKVVTLYREFDKTVGEVVKEFGLDKCTESTRTLYSNGQLDKWVTIIHAIEPRADRDPTKLDKLNMPWRSTYMERGAQQKQYLRESGFKRFPGVAPRWAISGGDIYGNSPGMECLGDVRQLQQEQLRKGQAIDYQTMPPIQIPNALKGRDVEYMPGGKTFTDSTGPSQAIQTLFDVNLNLQYLTADIQDVRQRIEGTFYADLFLMLANDTNGRMTATEVAERHEEKLLMLGPVLERLQNELLDPLINITFDEIIEKGIAPPIPDELQGHEVNVQLISMLAQAQQAIQTNSIDRFVMGVSGVAQAKPEALDLLNADKYVEKYGEALGIDPELINPADAVQKIRDDRAKAQQAAAAQQHMNAMADTAQKLASAQTTEPSALTDVTSQFSGYT